MPVVTVVVVALLCLALGALAGFLVALARTGARARAFEGALAARDSEIATRGARIATLEAELAADRARLAHQDEFLERSRKQIEDAVGNLASKALRENSEHFLKQANEKFLAQDHRSQAELDKRKVEIATLLKPLGETLAKLDVETKALEEKRAREFGSLDAQLKLLAATATTLSASTQSLSTALRGSSQARGRWGEMALQNVAELAGMTEHCDFDVQAMAGEGRPDMVVRLPGGGRIPVDAKVPLAAFLEALDGDKKPEERVALLQQHGAALRGHVQTLAGREYARALGGTIDFTVLFVPADPILAAAFEHDPDLQQDALRRKILIATPVTLVALLRTVATYWRQESVAQNAQQVADAARELYERVALFEEHLAKTGRGLELAVRSYNEAMGSFESRVLPAGRKLEELKAAENSKRRLEDVTPVDLQPRAPSGEPRALERGAGG